VNFTPRGESPDLRQFVVQFGDELCRCPFQIAYAQPGGHGLYEIYAGRGEPLVRGEEFARQWDELMDRLRAAPQLYIAV
jgi:hypothetical protein